MSDIELSSRFRYPSLGNPARSEISDIELLARSRRLSRVNLARGERSVMLLPTSIRFCRLVAVSSPVKLVMFLLVAESATTVSMSATVMVVPRALPR